MTDTDYEQAMSRIDTLIDIVKIDGGNMSYNQLTELGTLTKECEEYEDIRYPRPID